MYTLYLYSYYLAFSQERPKILECYECDPTNLQVRDPSKTGLHSTRMTCLTDDDDLGELKQCNLINGLCAVGKVGTLPFESTFKMFKSIRLYY